ASDRVHFQNFFDCIRNGKKPNSDIEDAQKSTFLCHIGNIAYRTGRTLTLDPKTREILNDKEATALRSREYRKEFEPKGYGVIHCLHERAGRDGARVASA